jgi:monoamine oxidase
MQRRHFLYTAWGAAMVSAGCQPDTTAHIQGGFTGVNLARGHALRDLLQSGKPLHLPVKTMRTDVLVLGGGVAGLAATRALRLRGVEDFTLIELEEEAGGNARGGVVGGVACPLGAHYLPVPGDDAPEVQNLLEELGLRQRISGRWQYDERHLCHSPQERLFFQGNWQEGLLPVQGVDASTLQQYQQFEALVSRLRSSARWSIPVSNKPATPDTLALAAITFVAFLDQHQLTDPHLRWYLDYCCRDDFGAGIATVSAWAGVHYFASRHGFHAPGSESAEREGVLTWPEGNGWLTRQLALPLGDRLHAGRSVLRVSDNRFCVEVDVLHHATQTIERWTAKRAIVALPIHIAARVVQDAPAFLRKAAQRIVYAPWLVANLHIREPLHDRPGAPPSWDNVIYGAQGLGYVDAMHQSLQPVPGATVLTYYYAMGTDPQARLRLLDTSWSHWRDTVLAELGAAHPDLAIKTTHIDITRYGHAMALPLPNVQGKIGLQGPQNGRKQLSKTERLVPAQGRLQFAHSDWAGYSVFEEAFTLGMRRAGA